ncbi:MAG: DegT/DnrJ/EryC1/StrS family aminotransferase [Planctomycetota bacterium]
MAVPRQHIRLPRGAWRRALQSGLTGQLWQGEDVPRFEQAFADTVGTSNAIAVSSGRAGLQAILQSLNLPPGSEVICPAFGYPVVPHLVRALGYSVKFVDCEMRTLGMDPALVAEAVTDQTAAIIAVHLYGVPCRIREIADIAAQRGIPMIEDCAHCLGARVGGRHVGTFGTVSYFSFETSKMINTLGGGMIISDDSELAGQIRTLAEGDHNKGMRWLLNRLCKTTFEHTVTSPIPFNLSVYPALRLAAARKGEDSPFASGYTADHFTMAGRTGRYTNYQARLGLVELEQAPALLERRLENARRLMDAVRPQVALQEAWDADAEANFMLVTGLFPDRAAISAALLRRGVDTKHHYMRDCSRALQTGEHFELASRAEAEVLHIPCFPEMSARQIDFVSEAVCAVAGPRADVTVADQPQQSVASVL